MCYHCANVAPHITIKSRVFACFHSKRQFLVGRQYVPYVAVNQIPNHAHKDQNQGNIYMKIINNKLLFFATKNGKVKLICIHFYV